MLWFTDCKEGRAVYSNCLWFTDCTEEITVYSNRVLSCFGLQTVQRGELFIVTVFCHALVYRL